jgi:hypothetical protein
VVPEGSYADGVITRARRSGRVHGRAELALRIESLTLPSGKVVRVTPRLDTVDDEGTTQRVVGRENEVKQGGNGTDDARRIATMGGTGAAIGGLADRSWRGAGIGAGAGGAVGLATVLLTRGREVELRQGSTFGVVFERAVPLD